MSGDLIRREDVLAVLCFSQETGDMLCKDMRKVLEAINAIPSAEPERTAKVETYTDDQQETWSVCECGTDVWKIYNYCPECGAKLDWGGDESC